MKKALLVVLALSGCASLPPGKLEALRARRPYQSFDPTGTWIANGSYRGVQVQNQRVTVQRDGICFRVLREHLRPDGIFERTDGIGVIDGDRLIVGYGPPGFGYFVNLWEPGAGGILDGLYANRHMVSGITQATPKSGAAPLGDGRVFSEYSEVGGNERSHFKHKLQFLGGPGAFWTYQDNGNNKDVGIAMLNDKSIVGIGLNIFHQRGNVWTGIHSISTASGYFGVAVYRMNNGVLEGQSIWGHSDMAKQASPPAPVSGAEQWTKG